MNDEWIIYLSCRNDSLIYALQFLDGRNPTEDDVYTQAERFFDFMCGDRPKKKKAKVIKLVKGEKN